MPYIPALAPPPVEESYVPPEATPAPEQQAAPVAEPAPAAEAAPVSDEQRRLGAAPAEAAPAPVSDEARRQGTAETAAPAEEVAPGPFTRAVQGVQDFVGDAVAPVAAALPEPIRNVADAVGQPVGGAIDTVTNVTTELGQGNLPGAALAALQPAMAPGNRVVEQTGTRVAEGQSATPQNDILSDPGNIWSILGGPALGAVSAINQTEGIDAWSQANPQAVQDAYAQGGGQGVVSAYLAATGVQENPPPQLSNPLDAGNFNGNPLERGLAIAGAVPDSLGGYAESAREGTLGPFIESQAIYALADPLSFVPGAVGARVSGAAGRVAGAGINRIPGVRRLTDLSPEAQRAITGEQIATGAEEVMAARAIARNDPGAAPAAGVTPGPATPPGNGPLAPPPDVGQPLAAAPAIPDPPTLPRTAPPDPTRPATARTIPPVRARPRQPVTETTPGGIPVGAPYRGAFGVEARNVGDYVVSRRKMPNGEMKWTARHKSGIGKSDQARRGGLLEGVPGMRGRAFDTYEDALAYVDEFNPSAKVATAPPSRVSLGIRRSRWIDAAGKEMVRDGRVLPEFEPTMRAAYNDMMDAPSEAFWEPYPASHLDVNVDVGDSGLFARYRGAMTQGRYMLDDWGTTHAMHRLPPELTNGGTRIDWHAVEQLANEDSAAGRSAQRAIAGKRALDLYSHRIATSPDPDVEVHNMLLAYHLDQVSGRFDKPQYRDTSYWADRAEMIGEAIRSSGYMPTPEQLAAWRTLNLADAIREAFPDLADAAAVRRLEGKTILDPANAELVVHTPGTERFGPRAVPLRPLTEGELRASDVITPETRPLLEANLRERLDKYGLTDIGLRLVDRLADASRSLRDAPDDARGVYQPYERLITLAIREADELPLSQAERVGTVLDHEVIHALRALDLFTAKEWDALVKAARDNDVGSLVSDDYAALERWSKETAQEELVAHLYESWRIGKITANRATTSLLQKLMRFFQGLGQALKDTYPEDILRRIESGEIGRRPRGGELLTPPQYALRLRRGERKQQANVAYANAPEPVRRDVEAVDDPFLTRYGVVASEQAVKELGQSADGLFRFADGYAPERGLTADDVLFETMADVEFWANIERISELAGNWSDAKSARLNRRWQHLDKRFNPDGTVDRDLLSGPPDDLGRQEARDAFALRVFREAEERARPKSAPKGRVGAINEAYLGTVRRLMLFNTLNIPRYVTQNMLTNNINMGAIIGAGAVWDLWTSPADFVRVFRSARSTAKGGKGYATRWASIEQQMGMGHKPNVAQSHIPYLTSGKLNKTLDYATRAISPETARHLGTTADQLFREKAAEAVVTRGYRRYNRELVPLVTRQLHTRGVPVPEAKIRQVVRDFLDQNRTLTDANTGAPYRTLTGRAAKGEAIWNPEEFGRYLKRRLREDMRDPGDTAMFNRAIDRITRDAKNQTRGILDEAEAKVDEAFFSWRDTNADKLAGRVFLYHYWASRQGGLYVQEALKRPIVLSTYGRMMEEFERQADELGQPAWLKGFFQFQNSVAGFSTWFSPFDLAQTLLTFADWQYGADQSEYKDLSALGKAGSDAPFLIHPLLQMVAYATGLLGPDYYAPPVTGAETFGAKAIDLLNLANAQGKLEWANAMGIGVDAMGNKVPLPVRPLQELYARVGNAISTALAPITGLTPVEVSNGAGSWERNIASIAEQEYRKAHPEADQMQVNRAVTDILADPGSEEYQAAFRKAAEMPYHLTERIGPVPLPGAVQGAMRLASPVQVYNWPEQYNLDRWNLTPSGYAPERNIPHFGEMDPVTGELTPAGERAKFVHAAAKYGATTTVEGRRLSNMQNEFSAIEPLDYAEADALAGALGRVPYGNGPLAPVTVGGVEYSLETLSTLSKTELYALGTQALADAGYSRDEQQAFEDAQARYLADNPDLAAYFEYKDLVQSVGHEQFVAETAMVNPGFAQFVRSSMMNHATGEIAYGDAEYVDAYLASQGRRPSVYSPLVGNEPSTIPGGYPALAGLPTGQPLLGQATATADIALYGKSSDADGGYYDDPPVAMIGPGMPLQILDHRAGYSDGLVQVSVGNYVGYVDGAMLANASPPQPVAMPGPAPAPVQPAHGLANVAGNLVGALGAGKDALGAVIGTMTGAPSTPPTKPGETSAGIAPGAYDVVPANDGMGEQSTEAGSDRSWMEFMLGNDAQVNINYKQPVTWDVSYDYQNGHGADGTTHSAYDIGCASGDCEGTPMVSPVAGRVVCAGYGAGTGEAIGSPQCTYSQNTTLGNSDGTPSAHTVVIEVGVDDNGNPIQLAFNHMGTSQLQPGQTINVGDALGTMGNTDGGPHVHLEGWLGDPASGYLIVDPQLIVGGYYGPVQSYATQGGAVITP